MEPLIAAAGRALAAGDALGALNLVALRDDAPALALRGIAMAQLGDLVRARILLRRAVRAFGPRQALDRARCVVAEAEVALAARELGWPVRALDAARTVLEAHGDMTNATHARQLAARRLLLLGRLDQAEAALGGPGGAPGVPALVAARELAVAAIAMRRRQAGVAHAALRRADRAARRSGIAALVAEAQEALALLGRPAARRIAGGVERALRLEEVEALLASGALVADACRRVVGDARAAVSFATRPVPFALARALAEAWPADVPRERLIALAFRGRQADESHRARLRVEAARLRAMLRPLAELRATRAGYVLRPRRAREVVVLAPPLDDPHAEVLALLGDGEAWSSSALAIALGVSQRSVQRALDALAASGRARPVGLGRARRWTASPVPGFATPLLLPPPFGGG